MGAGADIDRCEGTLRLTADSTMLLFTDGLVQSCAVSRAAGLERLRLAAAEGPRELDDLCQHVLAACTSDIRRDDDICLLGVRLLTDPVAAEPKQVTALS